MTYTTILLLLQTVCASVSFMLFIILAMSRVHLQTRSTMYERSRWLLAFGMFLLFVHYILQMVFGFRAQGDDIGALVNILFYIPVSYIISYVNMRMGSGTRHLRKNSIIYGVSYLLIIACFVAGEVIYHGPHIGSFLYAMGTIFLFTQILPNIYLIGETRRLQQQMENETADDISIYKLSVRSGTHLVYCLSLLVPFVILSSKIMIIYAPFILLSLTFYVLSFISLGFKIKTVTEVIDDIVSEENTAAQTSEAETPTPPSAEKQTLSESQIAVIDAAIAKWHSERGYSVSNLNSNTMAEHLGIPKKQLMQYLLQQKGETFRVWLSNLRIEEVKRMLLEKREYSHEAIAAECGFSSRSWMQEKFKAQTGMTPTEWKESYHNNVTPDSQ